MAQSERFGSRLGMMLAMLGMAVGTGNIWRFPRIAAKNGGGAFLIAWVLFLFLWSIPLIMLEFGMGRKTRSGPIKAFIQMMGPRWAWMGAFAVFVTASIMFYYSVVAGWTIRYTLAAVMGDIPEPTPGAFWNDFVGSWWPVLTHGMMIGLATLVVARGVRGIELVAKVLMPTLLGLVVLLTIRAVTLPGASEGLAYLFSVDWSRLKDAKLWVEALSQNAWDTGAGWGLVLCYAAYLRQREDTTLNAFILPTANNMVSLLAGVMVFCTVFSVVPRLVENLSADPQALGQFEALAQAVREGKALTPELMQSTIFDAGNEGLTFTWMPQLFATLPLGQFFMVLFFLALAFAAFTSLISMVEVATRAFLDAGMERARAIQIVGIVGFLLGLPSAISMTIFKNQDWVWGVALILAGLFFAISVIKHGIQSFRDQQLNHEDSDMVIGRWWDVVIGVLVPIQAVFLLVWFVIQARNSDPGGWLGPLGQESVGTLLLQWAVVLVVLIVANRWIVRWTTAPEAQRD